MDKEEKALTQAWLDVSKDPKTRTTEVAQCLNLEFGKVFVPE